MIRYCESIALIDAPERTHAQYRVYAAEDVHTLRFVKRAAGSASRSTRRALLALWRDKSRAGADVKRFAEAHIGDLETRIAELQAMAETLRHLARHCHGDARPDCPILTDLAAD